MVEMMHKNFLAMLLCALLLFTAPACGEDALAMGTAPSTPPDVSALPSEDSPPEAPSPAEEEIPADNAAAPSDSAADMPQDQIPPEEEALPARVIDPDKPMVALTFDDGPHPTRTDALLDILEENGAVATFFQVGQNLWKDPDAVRRAEEMGCEIGSHSYRHADLSKLSAEAIAADLQQADEAFIEVLGHAPVLLRPPYGAVNSAVKTTTGRSIITWSIDTEDWRSRNAEKVIASVQGAGDLNGQVILMHDVHASTIEAAETLVPWLIDQGYQLVTVSELITLHYGDPVLPNGLYGYTYFKFGKPMALPEGQEIPAAEPTPAPGEDAPEAAQGQSPAAPAPEQSDPPAASDTAGSGDAALPKESDSP